MKRLKKLCMYNYYRARVARVSSLVSLGLLRRDFLEEKKLSLFTPISALATGLVRLPHCVNARWLVK